MYDLVVIGGGPAGAAAAITAARSGATVLMLEKGRFPRHKVCGEFVSSESLDILETLLGRSTNSSFESIPRIAHARLFVDDSVLHTDVDPAAASISRYALDDGLWTAAVRAGVDARQQTTVENIAGEGPFTVVTRTDEFQCRAVINASGRWSNLSPRTQGTSGGQEKWLGLKAHFHEAGPAESVDLYFFEHGYCGVQPVRLGDHAEVNVCSMVRADEATSLPEVFDRNSALLKRSTSWIQTSEVVSTSPLVFKSPEPVRSNILNVGDAAGFVDPFVGDGISLGLRSGVLASECLKAVWEGGAPIQAAAEEYRVRYNDQLLPVFKTSSKIRRLFALPYPARAALLLLFGNLPMLTRYLVRRTR